MSDRRGMTLPEMMIALVVFTIAMGGAMGFLSTQQKAFQKGTDDMAVSQNLGFGLTALAQDIRTAGANVPAGQPIVVYAGNNSFAFNADLTSNVANDPFAIYYDPDAPTGSVSALKLANQITIPGSSPSRTWPLVNYNAPDGFPSSAETIIYWFELDTETSRTDDYHLMRQVNNGTADLVARNILLPSDTSVKFFSYKYLVTPTTGRQTLAAAPAAWIPLNFTNANSRNDSLRVVTVNYRVTNGLTGTRERIQAVSFSSGLPNVGLTRLQQCGDAPVYSGSFTATWTAASTAVTLTFPASADEAGGEKDIVRYVVFRRLTADVDWGDPYLSIPTGLTSYTYLDTDIAPNTAYTYSVSAQDCTPRLSGRLTSSSVTTGAF